jgi:hypothetical protein
MSCNLTYIFRGHPYVVFHFTLTEVSYYFKYLLSSIIGIRTSSVSVVTGYQQDGRGSSPGKDKKLFCIPQRPDRLWGPPSFLSNFYRGSLAGVKQPGREADHLYLVPRLKMVEPYLQSLYVFMVWCLINKHRDNLTLPVIKCIQIKYVLFIHECDGLLAIIFSFLY